MPERRSLPDQAARDLIEQRLDINLLVEAGAGSGKTESLARRMAAGIAEGVYQVEAMAAVTFTRKAAAELRGRFQIELERRFREERDEARRTRIRAALSHLERLFAGTIHAFCAHLLRERPVEAGVAPGFTELDDAADGEFGRRAWRDYLDRERAAGSPALNELLETGVKPPDLDEAFRTVCQYPEVDFPAGDGARPDSGPGWEALDAFWGRLRATLPDPILEQTTCKVQQRAKEVPGLLRVADRARPASLVEVLARWEGEPGIVQKWWPGMPKERKAIKESLDALIGEFQETTVRPFLSAWRQYVYHLAIPLLLGGRGFAAEARRRAVALNYGDLLLTAARLLRERLDVRAALQRKYRWLFVDEFQDTDPIQAEVILLLAAEAGAGREWKRAPLRPGALFIVGDPKQSIYRFRRADIETYTRVRQRIEETGGQAVELTTSFRAVPSLCRWANEVFRDLIGETSTPHQPAFHGLDPWRDEVHASEEAVVRRLTVPDGVEEGQVAESDAEGIARFIRAEVEAARRACGDFLILTRKKKQLPVYARALEDLHLPFEVSGGVGFAASGAVGSLAGLLRVLSDPDDGPALVGVLRGPLFGLSDPELFRHREAGRGFLLTAPFPEGATGPVADALRFLQAMHHWTRTIPVPAAVERILEATGLLAMAAAETPAGAEAGDLVRAVDRVRQVTEAGGSLAEAAVALEEDLESSEVEPVSLEPGRPGVVRVMNLHKAKGLEAPVVFLADPMGGVRERAAVRIIRDGGQAVGYFVVARPVGEWGRRVLGHPLGWAEHERAELEYVRAEEQRLAYVAATRARDLLIIGRWAKDGGRGTRPWKAFDPFLADAPELSLPPGGELPALGGADFGPEARATAAREREERCRLAVLPSWTVESVTATAHRAGPAGRSSGAGMAGEPEAGMAWGRLVHALVERAARGPRRDRAFLERLAGWFTVNDPELRRMVPEALDTVERIMGSEFWRRAMESGERLAEVPFAVGVGRQEGTPRVLSGVIDLALRFPGGWELVDYKTDQADAAGLVERYGDQVRAYARHWAGLTRAPVSYAGLYGIRAGQLSRNLAEPVSSEGGD